MGRPAKCKNCGSRNTVTLSERLNNPIRFRPNAINPAFYVRFLGGAFRELVDPDSQDWAIAFYCKSCGDWFIRCDNCLKEWIPRVHPAMCDMF